MPPHAYYALHPPWAIPRHSLRPRPANKKRDSPLAVPQINANFNLNTYFQTFEHTRMMFPPATFAMSSSL